LSIINPKIKVFVKLFSKSLQGCGDGVPAVFISCVCRDMDDKFIGLSHLIMWRFFVIKC